MIIIIKRELLDGHSRHKLKFRLQHRAAWFLEIEPDARVSIVHGLAAVAPVVVACGVRRLFLEDTLERARAVFELKDGALVPKPGVTHPRDPCADYDPVTWLADVRAGSEGDLLFGK